MQWKSHGQILLNNALNIVTDPGKTCLRVLTIMLRELFIIDNTAKPRNWSQKTFGVYS